MSFESVYCVTTRVRLIAPEGVETLAQALGMGLPIGYAEYLRTLGIGELCDLLRVHSPERVRAELSKDFAWRREAWVQSLSDGRWGAAPRTVADLCEAVTFASSAEGDHFICCPRWGSALFELPRHGDTIQLVSEGFYGAVEGAWRAMKHDFPFFETWDREHRWHRSFDVRPDLTPSGFIAAVKARWGADLVRQSRLSLAEHPNLFVPAVCGRMVLYGNSRPNIRPGSLEVGMSYDKERDAEVTAFIEGVGLAGSASLGEPSPWQD